MTTSPPKPLHRDWTQYLCPGPTRVFSAEEMAWVGQDALPQTIERYAVVNFAVLGVLTLLLVPAAMWLKLAPVTVLLMAGILKAARDLWRRPTRLRMNAWIGVLGFGAGLFLGWVGREVRTDKYAMLMVTINLVFLVASASALWFLTVYRVQQLETRLAERAARAEQDRLQRRLATAQIHPHFVFNTLASLTHWVESGDARAAPLLRDFSAYLRATLPMFERESQTLAEELDLVRRYLGIMAARMGDRLSWQVVHDASLDAAPLPTGSLLTLVENAVTHGVEPALRGGHIEVRTEPGRIVVRNTGEDLDPAAPAGLGLSNTRERLAAQGASLSLRPLHPGCEAVITLSA